MDPVTNDGYDDVAEGAEKSPLSSVVSPRAVAVAVSGVGTVDIQYSTKVLYQRNTVPAAWLVLVAVDRSWKRSRLPRTIGCGCST